MSYSPIIEPSVNMSSPSQTNTPSPFDLISNFSSSRTSQQTPQRQRQQQKTPSQSPRHDRSSKSPYSTPLSSSSPSASSPFNRIKSMDSHASQSIRAAHTILDCAAIVKELVENSLDAGATRVDVRLRGKAGLDSIVVSDNGMGIKKEDHNKLCMPSTTSKLRHDDDMSQLATFGFRGEALSAIRRVCASLSIVTRSSDEGSSATSLSYAHDGTLLRSAAAARPQGTTVSVTRLFHALPVRRKDALANATRELARCISVVQSLAIISVYARVELRVANDLKVRSSSSLSPSSTTTPQLSLPALRTSAQSVLGTRATSMLLAIEQSVIATVTIPPAFRSTTSQGGGIKAEYKCMGLVSRATLDASGSGGRARSSHHYLYINERPVDLPRVARTANEVYRRATGLSNASSTIILNFNIPPWACDVNLAPDKRHVLVHDEDSLIAGVVSMLENTWMPTTKADIPVRKETSAAGLQQSTIIDSFACTPKRGTDESQHKTTSGKSPVPCSQSPSVACSLGSFNDDDNGNDDNEENESGDSINDEEANDNETMTNQTVVQETPDDHALPLPAQQQRNGSNEDESEEPSSQGANPASDDYNNVSDDERTDVSPQVDNNNNVKDAINVDNKPNTNANDLNNSINDVNDNMELDNEKDIDSDINLMTPKQTSQDTLATSSPLHHPLPQSRADEDDDKNNHAEIDILALAADRLKRSNGGMKRRRVSTQFEHSEEEVKSSDWSRKKHRDVLKMTMNIKSRHDILNSLSSSSSRRSVLEYAGQGVKRVTSARAAFLQRQAQCLDHDGCDCKVMKQDDDNDEDDAKMAKRQLSSQSRIELHESTASTDGIRKAIPNMNDNTVDVVMDGNADDDISFLPSSQTCTQVTLRFDWDALCDDDSVDTDIEMGDEEKEEMATIETEMTRESFDKASMAAKSTVDGNETETVEVDGANAAAADRELSRLFRQEWFGKLRVIGQFNRGFILGQLCREVFIIDQHASDEKYNFEKLQSATQLQKQALVIPRQLEMSTEDELIVAQHAVPLRAGGFDVRYDDTKPPTRRITLHSLPTSKHIVFGEDDLSDIIHLLKFDTIGVRSDGFINGNNLKVLRPPRVRAMLASRACRKSIMIGTALHQREMKQVLANLATILHPWTCPHGRPTMRHLFTLPPTPPQSSTAAK